MTSRKVMTQPGVIKTRHPACAVRVVREMSVDLRVKIRE